MKKLPKGLSARRKNMRQRAEKRGLNCSLTTDDLWNLFSEAPDNCPCCGVEFNVVCRGKSHPSVDRFDTDKGYEHGNVYIICQGCNQIKGKIEAWNTPITDDVKNSKRFLLVIAWMHQVWQQQIEAGRFG